MGAVTDLIEHLERGLPIKVVSLNKVYVRLAFRELKVVWTPSTKRILIYKGNTTMVTSFDYKLISGALHLSVDEYLDKLMGEL